MKWILILWLGSPAVINVEFQTRDLCEAAKRDLIQQYEVKARKSWRAPIYVGGCYASHMGVK